VRPCSILRCSRMCRYRRAPANADFKESLLIEDAIERDSTKVVDERTIEETRKKNSKVVTISKMTVSTDGNTATFDYTDDSHASGDSVTGRDSMVRVGKNKHSAGVHSISGSWRFSKMETLSDKALTFTLRVDNDTLSMTNPIGESYSAKLDGTEAPYKGDPSVSSVSVKRLSKGTIEETDLHDGKAIRVKRMMIDPADLKTVHTIIADSVSGDSAVLVATKQWLGLQIALGALSSH
jgi:hypothetical protein